MSLDYNSQLERSVGEWGAALMGVADAAALEGLETHPAGLLKPFSRAVSIAVQMPSVLFETLEDRPTPHYRLVYKTANALLDQIALKTANLLESDGYMSLPIPASQIVDPRDWRGAISHKAVARMAGLGWQGKNLLLITPQYGARVRLVTVLTTAPLEADGPVENRCGECTLCQEACPAGAIKGVNTDSHYEDREEALYFDKCVKKLVDDFARLDGVGAPLCGLCIKVCPWGRKNKKDRRLF